MVEQLEMPPNAGKMLVKDPFPATSHGKTLCTPLIDFNQCLLREEVAWREEGGGGMF